MLDPRIQDLANRCKVTGNEFLNLLIAEASDTASPVESKWVLCPKDAQSNGINAIKKTVTLNSSSMISSASSGAAARVRRRRRPAAQPLDGPIERKQECAAKRTWLGIGKCSSLVGNLSADPQRWNSLPKRSKWDKTNVLTMFQNHNDDYRCYLPAQLQHCDSVLSVRTGTRISATIPMSFVDFWNCTPNIFCRASLGSERRKRLDCSRK